MSNDATIPMTTATMSAQPAAKFAVIFSVVGIFPNRPAARRLVGAVLAEQHDEWAIGRRYLTLASTEIDQELEASPKAMLPQPTAA